MRVCLCVRRNKDSDDASRRKKERRKLRINFAVNDFFFFFLSDANGQDGALCALLENK